MWFSVWLASPPNKMSKFRAVDLGNPSPSWRTTAHLSRGNRVFPVYPSASVVEFISSLFHLDDRWRSTCCTYTIMFVPLACYGVGSTSGSCACVTHAMEVDNHAISSTLSRPKDHWSLGHHSAILLPANGGGGGIKKKKKIHARVNDMISRICQAVMCPFSVCL